MAVKAGVVICVPLVGELEILLPPCDVPISAETALVNVGVRFTVAPYSGVVVEAEMDVVTAKTTITVVEADLVPSSFDVPVIVTLPAVAGAVHAPVLAFMVPALAVQLMPFVAPPEAVVPNVVELFTVSVGLAGLIGLTTTVCGVTVTELSV